VCAACSSNSVPGANSSAVPITRPSTPSHVDSSGPIGCLDPRVPAKLPAGGWLPDATGVSDYEPENAGVERSPSAQASMLATQVSSALGHGFSVSNVQDLATATCVVDRDVVLADPAGDVAFLRLLQLRHPLNDGSFPLVGNSMSRQQLTNGPECFSPITPQTTALSPPCWLGLMDSSSSFRSEVGPGQTPPAGRPRRQRCHPTSPP
jgi:hypothetical protein